ncbi:hypothetical protein [Coxiella endosymbiont of Ornithodoros amblus]|uniref:hypothetical protein n=1 Tax=Coxiella endosymbiont of Ornithodoros amblus TaxID=1656166 RepID=UPI00244E0EF5|nr:hypothetical protein [Coxiella endosymbiont of Ornithodoros amblus]
MSQLNSQTFVMGDEYKQWILFLKVKKIVSAKSLLIIVSKMGRRGKDLVEK